MSAAPQPLAPNRRHRPRNIHPHTANSRQGTQSPQLSVVSTPVERLSSSRPLPLWWHALIWLQRTSWLGCSLLAIATFIVYAQTVYTQQLWGREYRKLAALQRQERQLTSTNALLKNHLATLSNTKDTGLVAPKPGNAIFLPAVPQRQLVPPPAHPTTAEPITSVPLGY